MMVFGSSSSKEIQKLQAEVAALRKEYGAQKQIADALMNRVQELEASATPSAANASADRPGWGAHSNWGDRHDDSFSIYSQATTHASQPAAYLDQSALERAKAPPAMGWRVPPAVSAASEVCSQSKDLQAFGEADITGVLGWDNLQQVRAAVGDNIQPWLDLLMGKNSTKVDVLNNQKDVFARSQSRDQLPHTTSGMPDQTSLHAKVVSNSNVTAKGDQSILLACVSLLAACKLDEGKRVEVCQSDALPHICALLDSPNPAIRRVVAHLLWFVSRSPAAAAALSDPTTSWTLTNNTSQHDESTLSDTHIHTDTQPGDVSEPVTPHGRDAGWHVGRALVLFLAKHEEDDPHGWRAAALALNNLVNQHAGVLQGSISLNVIEALSSPISASHSNGQEAAAAALLSLTGKDESGIVAEQFMQSPTTVQGCLTGLRYGDPAVQESLAGVLQNVTQYLKKEEMETLLAAGFVPALMEVARSGRPGAQESALAALGNMATEISCHEALINAGVLELLSFFIKLPLPCPPVPPPGQGSPPNLEETLMAAQVQAAALLALRNMCTGKRSVKESLVLQRAVAAPLLKQARVTYVLALDPVLMQSAIQSLLERGAVAALVSAAKGAGGTWAQPGGLTLTPSSSKLPATLPIESEYAEQLEELQEHEVELQLWALRSLLSLTIDPALREPLLFETAAGPALLGVLLGGAPDAKELAAKVLTNLSIPDVCKSELIAQGAAMVLVPLVRTGHQGARQAACRAIQNLARLGSNRTELSACGAIPVLLTAIADGEDAAAGALYALCNHPKVLDDAVQSGASRVLLQAARASFGVYGSTRRGTKLIIRLLHRMALLDADVRREVSDEIAALGLF